MKSIINNINNDRLSSLSLIDQMKEYEINIALEISPNFDITEYEKQIDKEYFLEECYSLSNSYSCILSAELLDFGVEVDGELYRVLGDDRSLSYTIHSINSRESTIEFRGRLNGSGYEMDLVTKANLIIDAITNIDYKNLELYKQLIIDAHLLECESNRKMAFFTYYSAFEAFIKYQLDEIQDDIYPELHEALDHLSIDKKVRILAQEAFNTSNFQKIKIWGEFQGALNRTKKIRNLLAHGKLKRDITNDEFNELIACLIICVAFSSYGWFNFKDITEHLCK